MLGTEAKILYLPAGFEVLAKGDYVHCARTNRRIPLAALRYWNVDRQEAYCDAIIALEAKLDATKSDYE